jgi:ribosomal protein S20
MNAKRLRTGFTVAALLALNSGLSGLGYHGWYSTGAALAASAQEKAQARNSLSQVTAALRSIDTAYASGNAAEAQTRFEEARSNWDKVAPVISAREAREAQLLFDSLGKRLKDGAPPAQIKSTVSGMLEEFREDIGRELR